MKISNNNEPRLKIRILENSTERKQNSRGFQDRKYVKKFLLNLERIRLKGTSGRNTQKPNKLPLKEENVSSGDLKSTSPVDEVQPNKPSKFAKDFQSKILNEEKNESKGNVISNCLEIVPIQRKDRILKRSEEKIFLESKPVHSQENTTPLKSSMKELKMVPELKDDIIPLNLKDIVERKYKAQKEQSPELKEKIFKFDGIQTPPFKKQSENLSRKPKKSREFDSTTEPISFTEVEKKKPYDNVKDFASRLEEMGLNRLKEAFEEVLNRPKNFVSVTELFHSSPRTFETLEKEILPRSKKPVISTIQENFKQEVDVNPTIESWISDIERSHSPINLNVDSSTRKSKKEEISIDLMMEELFISNPIPLFDLSKRDFAFKGFQFDTEKTCSPMKSSAIQGLMNGNPNISSPDSPKKDELIDRADELDEVDPKILTLIEKWEPEGYENLSIEEKIQFREEEMRNYHYTIKKIIEEEKTNGKPPTFIEEYKIKKIIFYKFKIDSFGHSCNLKLKNSSEVLKNLKRKLEPKPEMDTKTKIELLLQRHEECVYQSLNFDQKIDYLNQKLIKIEKDINQIIQNEMETFRGKRNENGVTVYKFEGKSRGCKESTRLEDFRHKLKWEIKMGVK
jgi:hypothetical protein